MGRGPTPYQYSYEGLIPVSRLVILAIPLPQITSFDIALDITGMADSDSKNVQKVHSALGQKCGNWFFSF